MLPKDCSLFFLFSYPPKRHKFVYGKKIQCGKKSNVVRPSIDMVLMPYYPQNNINNIDCEESLVKLTRLYVITGRTDRL